MSTDIYFYNLVGDFSLKTDTKNWLSSSDYKQHTTSIKNSVLLDFDTIGRTEWITFNRDSGVNKGTTYTLSTKFEIGIIKCELILTLKGTTFGSDIHVELKTESGQTTQATGSFDSGSKSLTVKALYFDGSSCDYKFTVAYKTVVLSYDDVHITIEPLKYSAPKSWGYATSMDKKRASTLSKSVSKSDLKTRFVADFKTSNPSSVIYAAETYSSSPSIVRPEFRFKISESMYDYFFNGINGYRASYYTNPIDGKAFNKSLLTALTTSLLSKVPAGRFGALSKAQAKLCLGFQQAKIWIYEGNVDFGCNNTPLIDVEIFSIRAKQNKDPADPNSCKSPETVTCKPVWGTYAPTGLYAPPGHPSPSIPELEVKGGWIDTATGKEWINPKKEHRASEIAYYGFS